ncbi:MAG: AraC family transcriptional regulator [Christensenellales bacterium]
MNTTLNLTRDHSERVPYNDPQLPIYASRGRVSRFLNSAVSVHWHDDIEFSIITAGRMSYSINGAVRTLHEGEGIFINARQFHSNFSADGTDCEYICLLFHPLMLCAHPHLEKTSVTPVLTNDALPYAIFDEKTPWKAEMLGDIWRAYELFCASKGDSMLLMQSYFYKIWSLLYVHMPPAPKPAAQTGSRLSALRDMISYIQKNSAGKITLAEIAAAGKVCQSNCCALFQEYLRLSPVEYLIVYRLNQSAEMLKGTRMRMTEIAHAVGFSGASYFAEAFRKRYGCTPTEYRAGSVEKPE